MSQYRFHSQVIHKGRPPLCLKSHQQCRGCFGWRNMLKAAQSNLTWQKYPLKCLLTGLTLKIEREIE